MSQTTEKETKKPKKRFGVRWEQAAQTALDTNRRLTLLLKPLAFALSFYSDEALLDFLDIFQTGRDREFLRDYANRFEVVGADNISNKIDGYTRSLEDRIRHPGRPVFLPEELERIQTLSQPLELVVNENGRRLSELTQSESEQLMMDLVLGKDDPFTTEVRRHATQVVQYVGSLTSQRTELILQHQKYEEWIADRFSEESIADSIKDEVEELERQFYTLVDSGEFDAAEKALWIYKERMFTKNQGQYLFFMSRSYKLESSLYAAVSDKFLEIRNRRSEHLSDAKFLKMTKFATSYLLKAVLKLIQADDFNNSDVVFGGSAKDIVDLLIEVERLATEVGFTEEADSLASFSRLIKIADEEN